MLEAFDVEVLKLLFMIKYIKEIPGNVDNLTTMMVSRVDEDRLTLSKKVVASLERLIRETLILRTGDVYSFLTNEEQDINRAINNEIAELGEINTYIAQEIFEGIYRERRYRHSTRYNFDFNRMVDGNIYGMASNEQLGINILTPYTEDRDDQALRMQTSQNHVVLVNLPPSDDRLVDEISRTIKLNKYLQKHGVDLGRNNPGIKGAKEAELESIKARVQGMLKDALRYADIYVRGDKLNITGREPADRLNEALGRQVQNLYARLQDMQTAPSQNDVEGLLVPRMQTQFELDVEAPNAAALTDVIHTLGLLGRQSMVRTTLKTLLDRYMKPPYGFVPLDVQWLVAYLFAHGKVNLSYNNQALALGQTSKTELVNYLTRNEHRDKLVIDLRLEVPQNHKLAGESFMRKWFGTTSFPGNEDQFIKEFREKAEHKKSALSALERHYDVQSLLPGKPALEHAQSLLVKALRHNRASDFFRHVFETQEEWEQALDRLTPVESFLGGDQRSIYEKALRYRNLHVQSRAYITDRQVIGKMAEIETILEKEAPYAEMYKLPPLLEAYGSLHVQLLERESTPVRERIEADRKLVLDSLEASLVKEEMLDIVISKFQDLMHRVEHGKSVYEIRNLSHESDAVKINLINEINHKTAQALAQKAKAEKPVEGKQQPSRIFPQPVYKPVSLRTLVSASTTLKSTEEIELYLDQLRSKLLDQLQSGDVDGINVVL